MERGNVVRTIETGVGDVAFDRTGARLVTFDGEVVETWNVGTGARVAEGQVDAEVVVSSVLSSDGSRIAAALPDGTIRLFDASTGERVTDLHGHAAAASTLSFSPDDSKLVTTGYALVGDSIRIWALDIDDLLDIARREVTRELTDEECRQFLHVDRCPAT